MPSHDLHIDQVIMYKIQQANGGIQLPITRLCKEPRSYIITTKEGVQCRKTQAHLKLYQPQNKKSEDEHSSQSIHMWTVKNESKRSHISENLVNQAKEGH